MSDRYAEVASRIAGRLAILDEAGGLGIVVTAASQQALVAAALVAQWPDAISAALAAESVELVSDAPPKASGRAPLVATLPADGARAVTALIALNDARQRLASAGRLVILVVSRSELQALQRHAGDSYSTARFVETCPFVPDPAIDHDQAREALARWLRHRVGRLDLRGFIRAHTEDVSWTVEDVYQTLRGREWGSHGNALPLFMADDRPLVDTIARRLARPDQADKTDRADHAEAPQATEPEPAAVVLLGHPGAGKTFFLRWLALHAVAADRFLNIPAPLPILISLAAFARAARPLSLYDYMIETLLQEGQPAAHVLARAMEQGQVLFLLDGLDEAGDEAGRRQVARAVHDLAARASNCPIVATSRISGYGDAPLAGHHVEILPLDDAAIEGFLIAWCRLYACELRGAHAAGRGEDEGRALARDVLSSPELKALAQTPLLLTVLAIVHRAGVRLPDHRVELYSHATQVLVERWNQVRSLSGTGSPVPIKLADAVRLLGPVALDMVRTGTRGALSEEALEHSLERSLAARPLRSIGSAREALDMFQRSLGLLVEQGPGMYGFLHLTLAEYFAAWELVRSGELEALARNPEEAFQPRWREVILLAAGELGVNRADDVRLDHLVDTLLASAARKRGRPSPTVPSLLAGLLADDPGLSERAARDIVNCLIPTWWLERRYSDPVAFSWDVYDLVTPRISQGRFAAILRQRLRDYLTQLDQAAFDRLGLEYWWGATRIMVRSLGVDDSSLYFLGTSSKTYRSMAETSPWEIVFIDSNKLQVGRKLAEAKQRGELLPLTLGILWSAEDEAILSPPPARFAIRVHMDWNAMEPVPGSHDYVNVPVSIEPAAGDGEVAHESNDLRLLHYTSFELRRRRHAPRG